MQTLIFILIIFLISIFASLLYFKNKNFRVTKLNAGTCPLCGEKTKYFFDEKTNTNFKVEVITKKVLKNHGCSGVNEIEYKCKKCGLKEVYPQNLNTSCGL